MLTGPRRGEPPDPDVDWPTPEGAACFYCGKACRDPSIMWAGLTGEEVAQDDLGPVVRDVLAPRLGPIYESREIYLHPRCARSLCIRLLRDVWEWECRVGDGDIEESDLL